MHKIGVIGVGFVGTAVSTGLQNVAEVREHDKYKPSEDLYDVVNESDIIFFCLPTPMNEDGSCDTTIIEEVAAEASKIAKEPKCMVIKSTVPPGTTEELSKKHKKHTWIFNPEFLTEKSFIGDFLEQDRLILGITENSKKEFIVKLDDLYEDFFNWTFEALGKRIVPKKICKSEEAEMVKYVANSFLATKVTFFNEVKEICDGSEINYNKVVDLVCLDKRIGNSHTTVPGSDGKHGFGGSCFPKDINEFISFARDMDVEPLLLESVWAKNTIIREEYDWEDLAQVNGNYEEEG